MPRNQVAPRGIKAKGKVVSTDQPARYLALLAIVIACASGSLSYVGASVLAARATRDEVKTCKDLEHVKDVTRQALRAAIQRAEAALPDPAARASIRELRREIRLIPPRKCE